MGVVGRNSESVRASSVTPAPAALLAGILACMEAAEQQGTYRSFAQHLMHLQRSLDLSQCRKRCPRSDGRGRQWVQETDQSAQLAAQAVPHCHAPAKVLPCAGAGRQGGQPCLAAADRRRSGSIKMWCCKLGCLSRQVCSAPQSHSFVPSPPTQALALLPPERLGGSHGLKHGFAAEGQSDNRPQAGAGDGGGGGSACSRRAASWVH